MKTRQGVALLVALAVGGCGTLPEVPSAQPQAVRGDWIPPGAKLSFAVGRFSPALSVEKDVTQIARDGARAGIDVCAPAAYAGYAAPVLLLICLPIGALIGGAGGAIAGAAPDEKRDRAQATTTSASGALSVQSMLAASVERYARENGVEGLGVDLTQGPQSPDERPRYGTGDYVLEISVTELNAAIPFKAGDPYDFGISATGRLIRVADDAVVNAFSKWERTRSHTVEQWVANEGFALREEIGVALERIARSFIDEWVLIYPGTAAPQLMDSMQVATGALFPDHVLRAVYPPIRESWPSGRSVRLVWADSVTPTLTWERLPRAMQAGSSASVAPRVRNLAYEVQIFDGARQGKGPMAVDWVSSLARSYKNLTEPSLHVREPLSPCEQYYWRVRAHFELDGRRRVTEWSSAGIEHPDGSERRRKFVGTIGREHLPTGPLYRFRTPCRR